MKGQKTMFALLLTINDNVTKRPISDELILKIANGDSDALHELYEAASDSVYGFALSITKNTYDAEDVLQDTFFSIYKTAPTYKPAGKPMAWVLTIAKNKALSTLREQGRVAELDENSDYSDEKFFLEKEIEDKLLVEALMNSLKDDERQILMLHAVSSLKHREIARLLELPLGTVLAKYNRAVKKLRERGDIN